VSRKHDWSPDRIRAAAAQLAGARVLICGDAMLDEYLFGDAERISPEAPIPIVHVDDSRVLVGGAGNVARNIRALGGEVCLISVCGVDEGAATLKALLHEEGVTTMLQHEPGRPTTLKTRILARQQQMLRVDRETAGPLAEETRNGLLAKLAEAMPQYDVFVISDYGKGLVSATLMDGIRSLAAKMPVPPRILVDPKVPNLSCYTGADLLTPNAKETSEGTHMPVNSPEAIMAAGRTLMARLASRHLLTTLGARGMALFLAPDEIWHIPTMAREVFDVTGAGDTVIATVALALAAGVSLIDACLLANYAAGIVVGEVGAATTSLERLMATMQSLPRPDVVRWA
jgi:rfaE bifunctional protein kinase chain/domain